MTQTTTLRRPPRALPPKPNRRFFNAIVFLLPTLAALGPLTPGLGPFFGFRIAAVLAFCAALAIGNNGLQRDKIQRAVVLLITVTVLTSGIFFAMGQIPAAGWRELLSVATGFALLIAFTRVPLTSASLRALTAGWLVAFGVTAWVAWLEITTGARMPNYLVGRDLVDLPGESAPASTLGNPNDYATMLVIGVPILLAGVTAFSSRFMRLLFVAALALTPILVNSTGSRLGLAVIALMLLLLLALHKHLGLALAIPLIIVGIGVALAAEATITPMIDPNVNSWGDFLSVQGSGSVRIALLANGFLIAASTAFLGVGPGGFATALSSVPGLAPTGGIESPHGLITEVLSQYGVVVLAALVWLLVAVVRSVWSPSRKQSGWSRLASNAIIAVVVLSPVWSTMASTMLSSSVFWLFLAAIAWISQPRESSEPDAVDEPEKTPEQSRTQTRPRTQRIPTPTASRPLRRSPLPK
ncbi:O-antigen ligase family protein [Microbacterium keratanolyticum]|uniref:O-antigen ligase family protein n=1 Tax=Microbacterium keratanolyticum TaxID=67574 RepID=UPI003640E4B6